MNIKCCFLGIAILLFSSIVNVNSSVSTVDYYESRINKILTEDQINPAICRSINGDDEYYDNLLQNNVHSNLEIINAHHQRTLKKLRYLLMIVVDAEKNQKVIKQQCSTSKRCSDPESFMDYMDNYFKKKKQIKNNPVLSGDIDNPVLSEVIVELISELSRIVETYNNTILQLSSSKNRQNLARKLFEASDKAIHWYLSYIRLFQTIVKHTDADVLKEEQQNILEQCIAYSSWIYDYIDKQRPSPKKRKI